MKKRSQVAAAAGAVVRIASVALQRACARRKRYRTGSLLQRLSTAHNQPIHSDVASRALKLSDVFWATLLSNRNSSTRRQLIDSNNTFLWYITATRDVIDYHEWRHRDDVVGLADFVMFVVRTTTNRPSARHVTTRESRDCHRRVTWPPANDPSKPRGTVRHLCLNILVLAVEFLLYKLFRCHVCYATNQFDA